MGVVVVARHHRVNGCLNVLRTMLKAAARKGYIKSNPAADCERMVGGGRVRGILTSAEVKAIFDESNIQKFWGGNIALYTINLLGASTGMRCGECQGLQVSWHQQHGIVNTHLGVSSSLPKRGLSP